MTRGVLEVAAKGLQSVRCIDGIADHGERQAFVAANIAGDPRAVVEPVAERERRLITAITLNVPAIERRNY